MNWDAAIKYSKRPCTWTEDEDGNWDTGCNEKFIVIEDSPVANGMNFCPYCGRTLKEKRHKEGK